MHFTPKTLKLILYITNILCAFFGLKLIWFGIWLLRNGDEADIDIGEHLAAIVTILLGIVVFLIAIYGCVATCLESKRLLISYVIILIVLLIIQLILLSISYTAASDGMSEGLKQGFDDLWIEEWQPTNSTLSYYEEKLQCCGKNGAEDYILLNKTPPSSCCKLNDCTIVSHLYLNGCEQTYKKYVEAKTGKFNSISWQLIVIEFLGSLFACVLLDSLKNRRDRLRFYS